MPNDLSHHILELIKRASTRMPTDVVKSLERHRDREIPGSRSERILTAILENINVARDQQTPICQDTGNNIYYVSAPPSFTYDEIERAIHAATRKATKQFLLRANAVDAISGENSNDGVGAGLPQIVFRQWNRKELKIDLVLKGGGAEDVSNQYRLPEPALRAARNLDGVARSVIDAVQRAQGLGCAPGIIGVGIGGDRETSHHIAKEQLLRKLDDKSSDKRLAQLERELYETLNRLGIGPMGFGGRTTVLAVKIGAQHRHPNNFFVSVAYGCWANRRATLTATGTSRRLKARVTN
ncbi:MAG TPA: fumarate hydratase [Myxococcota bacterium]|jgi:fumarate hydratase class I|nr:fumarate hydratase [Myxococcota bacterium]